MIERRSLLGLSSLALAAVAVAPGRGLAADTPGVAVDAIKIGSTTALSGPVSALGVQGLALAAFFRQVNERGGVAGRKIDFTLLDDGFSPPKTVEQTRRLVEQDGVAFMLNMLGTPTNTAVVRYLNQKKVPHLFLSVNADKWGYFKEHPWTIGFAPSGRIEAQIYTKHILATQPEARVGVLHQNDDNGKDFLNGVRDVLAGTFDRRAVVASYEVTDPTVDSQLISLQAGKVDALVLGVTPKFAAQAIHRLADMNWKPLVTMANSSTSIAGVIQPAGPQNAVGVVSSTYIKDPNDPAWKDDQGMKDFRAFMAKYMHDADAGNWYYLYGYMVGQVTLQVLYQCGEDLSRENIMRQATNLQNLMLPVLLPGILVNTSPTNYHPIRQMQLQKWDGTSWQRFDRVIEVAAL